MRLNLAGTPLAARLWGRRGGLPVLALHGWLDNAASFDALAPALLDDPQAPPLQLVALDLPGHGHSAWRPPQAAYDLLDYTVDVLAAADALGWSRFAVVGHSLGAGIATVLGGALPERLLCAILVDGLGPVSMAPEKGPEILARALADRRRVRGPGPELQDLDAAVAARQRSRIAIGEAAARRLCERGTVAAPGGGLRWRSDPRLADTSLSRLAEQTVLAFIAAMRVPTLLLEAEAGVLHGLPSGRYAARLAAHPSLERVTVPGGHHPHLEAGVAEVARHGARFLRAHGAA